MNQVRLIGNLGKDPEVTTFPNGTMMVKFTLATNEKTKDDQKTTQWHNIVCFDECAKKASELKKGKAIDLSGKITYRQWEGKDGVKRTTTEIKMFTFALPFETENTENEPSSTK